MRRSRPLAAMAGLALLALTACGGGGTGGEDPNDREFEGAISGVELDPDMQGPAPEIDGAQTGGTVTVLVDSAQTPITTLDPTEGWSVLGNSIQQALTHRALTQYYIDPDGNAFLVPDLATDLGQANADNTEWTFTIKEGVKWEDGKDITAEEVAFGIKRSLDVDTFPGGPGAAYSTVYFKDGDKYKGPYTDKGKDYDGVTFDNEARTVTIKMSGPFADMSYWGAFMAMGPIPLTKSDPPAYGKRTLSSGPYKVESFRPEEELVLVKNDQWDPATDPARHQYADKWVFKLGQDPNQNDQIMLSGNEASQTSLTLAINSTNYQKFLDEVGDRMVQQSAQCTSYLSPDYNKIDDINVRKAIAYAFPYEDVWTAQGEVPGVTRVPANSVMPPGMSGKKEYFVDGEQITYDPDKAKELLAEAGYEPGEFKLTNVYYDGDPLLKDAQKALETGMEAAGFDLTGIASPDADLYAIWTDPDNKINKKLNLRQVAWCSDWPSGLTMVPPLLGTDQPYNTAYFSEKEVDDRIKQIPSLPADEQAAAWGDLDEEIATKWFPLIPTAFRNDLFVHGEKIGGFQGDPTFGAPYYKDLFVTQ